MPKGLNEMGFFKDTYVQNFQEAFNVDEEYDDSATVILRIAVAGPGCSNCFSKSNNSRPKLDRNIICMYIVVRTFASAQGKKYLAKSQSSAKKFELVLNDV